MVKVLFMGRKPVAAAALKWLLQRDDVDVVGVITDSHLAVSPTSDMARNADVPILDRETAEQQVQNGALSVDLGLSMLYWQKIRWPLLRHCSRGVVNFHPAPLPEYKGTAGYNLAILEDLPRWAVSAHYVDEYIDTGDIIQVREFSLDRQRETARTLEAKSQPLLLTQFQEVTARLLESESPLPTTANRGGRYVSRAQMEAMKEVKEGDDVERKIRAFWFPPYDGAYRVINGVKCTLVSRAILESLADPTTSSLFTDPS
jgi:methionyl-tRNA formyltransferase